jgi:hypothetical protein
MARADARRYSALRWLATAWIWLVALCRLEQLRTSETAPSSDRRVAALELSRLLTTAAWRDARVPAGAEDAGEAACDEAVGVLGDDPLERARPTMIPTTTTASAATAKASLLPVGSRPGC